MTHHSTISNTSRSDQFRFWRFTVQTMKTFKWNVSLSWDVRLPLRTFQHLNLRLYRLQLFSVRSATKRITSTINIKLDWCKSIVCLCKKKLVVVIRNVCFCKRISYLLKINCSFVREFCVSVKLCRNCIGVQLYFKDQWAFSSVHVTLHKPTKLFYGRTVLLQ